MDNLKTKALTGCVKLIFILAFLIFLPAFTLRYWQGWLFIFTMGAPCLALTLYFLKKDPELIKRRMESGPNAEKEKKQKVIQSLSAILVVAMYAGAGFDYHFNGSVIPMPLVLFSNICVLSGFYIIFLVFKENSYTSAIIEVGKDQSVISTGPYAVVRHPMYSGAALLFIFTPLALSSWWALIPAVLLIINIIWRLLDEERFLKNNLKGYQAYCQHNHYRLLPLIW